MTMNVERLEESGFETRRYSGRGMYGAECIAFEVIGGSELGAVAEIISSIETVEEQAEVVKAFKQAKTDSMGRDGIVIYFPKYKYAAQPGHEPDKGVLAASKTQDV